MMSRTYEIRDASGVLVAFHDRWNQPDGSKRFAWRRPGGDPGLGGRPVTDLPLYGIDRLDGLAASVVLVEGERACEALWDVGIAAVGTVTGAATSPSERVFAELTGRQVIAWPDGDEIGERHMRANTDALRGIAGRIAVVVPPARVPAGWDAADAVSEGRDIAALLASAIDLDADPEPHLEPRREDVGTLLEWTGLELLADDAADEEVVSLPFLGRPGYLREGWSHLVTGYPRVGKTELLAELTSEWLLAGRSVLYITEEARQMWRARLRALAARRPEVPWERLHVVPGLGVEPAAILDRMRRGADDVTIVDAARNLLGITDENNNSEVARALNPLIVAARAVGTTLVVAHHDRKGGGDHGEGIAGGHAFLAVFDVALELLRDQQAPRSNRRVVRPYARLVNPPELMYERAADGSFRAIGEPGAVQLANVEERLLTVLRDEPQKTSVLHAALGDPQPSLEQVRQALNALAALGTIERDPPWGAGDARGKTVRWSVSAVAESSNGSSPRLELFLATDQGSSAVAPPVDRIADGWFCTGSVTIAHIPRLRSDGTIFCTSCQPGTGE